MKSPGQPKRSYVLKERAASQAATRRRIVEATMAYHQEIGPAATRLSDVARRAGVQRATVYNHFPDDAALFAACSAHWRELHPAPDPARWFEIDDPGVRLRAALRDVYGWYRETERMTANVLRDAQILPALEGVLRPGLVRYLSALPELLVAPFDADDEHDKRMRLAARAAVDFHFWRALEPLGDEKAAQLGAGLVELAALG